MGIIDNGRSNVIGDGAFTLAGNIGPIDAVFAAPRFNFDNTIAVGSHSSKNTFAVAYENCRPVASKVLMLLDTPCEVEDEDEKPDPQRLALIALYNATNGDQWTRNDGWLSSNPLKHWRGVTVDDFGRVIRLGLVSNDMHGKIPPELRHLTALQTLSLGDNSLSSEILPELGQLSDLTELWLGDNELSGEIPPQLGQLAKLEYLDLLLNQLSGKIPPELG